MSGHSTIASRPGSRQTPQDAAPAHSPEAEQAVLGGLLLAAQQADGATLSQALELLGAGDFCAAAHMVIFGAMNDLHRNGRMPDLVTVTDHLKQQGRLDDAGGAAYVTGLLNATFSAVTLTQHVTILKRDAAKRALGELGAYLLHHARDGEDLPNLVDLAQRTLEGVRNATGASFTDDTQLRMPVSRSMPEDGYVGIAADFANVYAGHTEAPRPFLYFAYLTYLGAIIAHRVTLASELQPSPRLYTVCLGPSADGRKSSALDHADRFFRETIVDFGEHVHYGLGSAEGLARRLGRDETTGVTRPLLLHLDELRVLVDKSRPEGSIITPMLAMLFERTVFDNTTKTHKISVRDGYLSLVAACTQETYAAIWTPAFLDIGFTNRLWLVTGTPERRIALPAPIPSTLRQALAHDLGQLLASIDQAAGTGRLSLRLDQDAARIWDAWYQTMPRTIHSRRLDTYGWRFMILLSLSRGNLETISADTVCRVCALLDHQFALRQEFDPIDAEGTVARLEVLIRRALRTKGPLGKRDLRRHTNGDRYGLWAFGTALDNLERAGDLRCDRGSRRYALVGEVIPDA